jgi:serine/threonine protein kinase
MNETSTRWHQIAPSEFPWEREALAFVREGLPDHEPYQAWANFEVIAEDGSIHEVDLLVLSPKGFFLVEIKSWEGTLEGDASTWVLHRNGKVQTWDSPLLLANRKARKLASLLKRHAPKDARLPFLEPLVFLSNPNLQCRLSGSARQGVWLRDGILSALKRVDLNELYQARKPRIDRPMAKLVLRAVEAAGIRPTQRARRVGDYQLLQPLFEGSNFQDWEARHVSSERLRRRVRIYPVSTASGAEARARLERAARREVEVLEPLTHPGLLKPLHHTQHELGPALVFEHDPRALRLDHYLVQAGSRLGFEDRLALVRQIAETLRYCHDKRLFHRALSPQSILVWNPEEPAPLLRILDWQTAAHAALPSGTSVTGLSGTSHLDQLVEAGARVYVAPEALTVSDTLPEALDVFSLGALAYLIFSGKPPAASVLELHDLLSSGQGLLLSAGLDGAPPDLSEVIRLATHPVVTERIASAADFLGYLDLVEEDLTQLDEPFAADPLAARAGERLPGGFLVKHRLGKGSTSVVYLVKRDGREQVLKLALDADADKRLQTEADVLRTIDHPRIVQLQDTVQVGERLGLLLARAGEKTVTQRLREEGRFQLELLQRFGEDLLQAVDYLERQGIPHRDIKPDNLGVAEVGRNRELHLVLFDFSLAGAGADNIFAGTRHYLDPFLRERKPRRWDLQAERFSAAVTLYEMSTGTLPRWGDGQTDPYMLKGEEVQIESELLDAAVRAPLTDFFSRALRREAKKRFDNAEEMLAAWTRAFQQADRPPTVTTEEQPDELARACARADLETSVSLLHLSTRAVNALERAQVTVVRELLRLPVARIHSMRGVGSKTRKELLAAIRHLEARLGPSAPPLEELPLSADDDAESAPVVVSLDLLIRQILPASGSRTASERRILETLFGLSDEVPRHPSLWPSQTETAEALGLTRARVSQVLVKARQRWARNQSLALLRSDIGHLLTSQGGAMTARELSTALLTLRGSAQEERLRLLYAAAALRAATETEENQKEPLWTTRRSRNGIFLALTELGGERMLDFMELLGRRADELAATDPLASPQRALEVLQSVLPPGLHFPPERLLRLAASASQTAGVSSRLEIYPRGLSAARALRLASGTLLGAPNLSVVEVRERIRSRFPEAEEIPGRPRLDALLTDIGLAWDSTAREGQGAYRFPEASALTSSTTLDRARTTPGPTSSTEMSPDVFDAHQFEERLARTSREGGFLALEVDARFLIQAEEELARRFPLDLISLEERWLEAMRQIAAENEVDWNIVLRADAAPPDHPDSRPFSQLLELARERVEAGISSSERTILLTRSGLLARYGRMDLVERLRDLAGTRPHGDQPGLHGLWVLVPADGQTTGPQIEGKAVPFLTAAQRARIPVAWILNQHRGGGLKDDRAS